MIQTFYSVPRYGQAHGNRRIFQGLTNKPHVARRVFNYEYPEIPHAKRTVITRILYARQHPKMQVIVLERFRSNARVIQRKLQVISTS